MDTFNNKKRRIFAFVLYEESVTKDYLKQLEDRPVILSPWHDNDKNDDGSTKKKHRHALYIGKGNVSPQFISTLMEWTGGVLYPREIVDPDAMIRYFIHADNPEKAQYSINDMICCGGTEERMKQAFQNKQKAVAKSNPYLIDNTMFLNKFREINNDTNFMDFSEFIYYVLDNVEDTQFLDACMAKHIIITKLLQCNYFKEQRKTNKLASQVIETHRSIEREIAKDAKKLNMPVEKFMYYESNINSLEEVQKLPRINRRKTEN